MKTAIIKCDICNEVIMELKHENEDGFIAVNARIFPGTGYQRIRNTDLCKRCAAIIAKATYLGVVSITKDETDEKKV